MAEANGHDISRGQIREIGDDGHSTTPALKRQRSERTILAGRLGDVQLGGDANEAEGNHYDNDKREEATSPGDDPDCAGRALQGFFEHSLDVVTGGRISTQIGFERENIAEEQFESNIVIKHPYRGYSDNINLGIHFREHKNGGFIVRKVMEDGLIADKGIRVGDIVTHVAGKDVRNMSLAEVQSLFWNLTFETTFTLKILRLPESEDESDGKAVGYEELIIHVTVTMDDDFIQVKTEVNIVRSTRYFSKQLQERHFYISVYVGGNPRYLCAQQDMTLKASILSQGEEQNPNYLWKQQFCIKHDDTLSRLLYNVGTGKTISACNIVPGESPCIVKMSSKAEFDAGSYLEFDDYDRLFRGNPVTEGKDTYYLESVSHPAYYMCLSSDPKFENCLEMATESSHPKTEFHFEFPTT